MNEYTLALYLHIVGALGFFVALGLEWTSVRQLRRAETAAQVREWLRLSNGMRRVGPVSMLTLLASGIYMMVTAWGPVAWMSVTLATLVPFALVAVALSGRRMAAIAQAVSTVTGSMSPALRQALHHPLLWVAIQIRLALALGIVFLMTAKPDLSGSLLAIGIATVLGLASALPILRRRQAQQQPAV